MWQLQHGRGQEDLTRAQTPQRRLGGHRPLFRGREGPIDSRLQKATANTGRSKKVSLVRRHRNAGSVVSGGSLEADTGPIDSRLQKATANTGRSKKTSLVRSHRSAGSVGTGSSLEAAN